MSNVTKVPFPLRYTRQQGEAIDVDWEFTTEGRMAYLTSGRRYAGQIVFDTTEDKLYRLNGDTNAWIPLVGVDDNETTTNYGVYLRIVYKIEGYQLQDLRIATIPSEHTEGTVYDLYIEGEWNGPDTYTRVGNVITLTDQVYEDTTIYIVKLRFYNTAGSPPSEIPDEELPQMDGNIESNFNNGMPIIF